MAEDTTATVTRGDGGDPELIVHTALLAARRYDRQRELARGGSGRIIAARDLVFDRAVAIKEPLDPARGGARLRAEAAILARLQHPSIIPVYDTGVWANGVPFYAMKLVEGRSLRDALLDAPRFEQRLAFVPQLIAVAEAIAYAHARGVIHRDLKPGNVLVGQFGETIVIDWGLAKHVDAASDATIDPAVDGAPPPRAGVETATGSVLGTPAYMPPEQAGGAAVDPRSDVYALGAILYHLLTGAVPFSGASTDAVISAAARGEPPAIEALQPRAPADLVAIARKAMARDPAARYPSAGELAEDLRRFATGRLVTARRYSVIARLRRWLRARRAPVLGAVIAGGAVAAVALAMMPDAAVDPAVTCARGGDAIRTLWDPDHRLADRAPLVRAALRAGGRASADDVFARVSALLDRHVRTWSAARVEACVATRVRGVQSDTLLDLRMACLDQRRGELDAMLQVLATPRPDLIDRAVSAVTRLPPLDACSDARGLQAEVPPPADPATAAAVEATRRSIATARALFVGGAYREGLPRATEAVRVARSLGYAPLVAEALFVRAQLEGRTGDGKAAEETWRATLIAAGEGRSDALASLAWGGLIFLLAVDLQRPGDALALQTAGEAALHRAGDDPAAAGRLWDAIGVALYNHGAPAEAITYYRRALDIRERTLGRDHIDVAATLSNLSDAMTLLDKPAEAVPLLLRARDILERALGPDHPNLAVISNNLGNAYLQTGDLQRALVEYQRAIDITTRTLGPEHPDLSSRLNNLGLLETALGRYDDAVRAHLRALEVIERARGPESRGAALVHTKLGTAYLYQDKLDDARRELERALAIGEHTLGASHIDLGEPLTYLGRLALRRGDTAAASRYLVRGRAIVQAALGADHPWLAEIDAELASVALAEGRLAEARTLAERSVARLAAHTTDLALSASQFILARVLWTAPGDRPRALALARTALGGYERSGAQAARPATEIAAWLAAHDAASR